MRVMSRLGVVVLLGVLLMAGCVTPSVDSVAGLPAREDATPGYEPVIMVDGQPRHPETAVPLQDRRFERELLRYLDLPGDAVITLADAAEVEQLALADRGIQSIQGIEWFAYLSEVDLSGNPILNVEPLAALQDLKRINLSNTPVFDLSPLVRLSGLESLLLEDVRAWVTLEFTEWYLTLEQVDFLVTTEGQVVTAGDLIAPAVIEAPATGAGDTEPLRVREDLPVIDWATELLRRMCGSGQLEELIVSQISDPAWPKLVESSQAITWEKQSAYADNNSYCDACCGPCNWSNG